MVALAVVRRGLRHLFGNPALLVPSMIFPLLFLVAFAGGLSSVGDVPGFDFPPGYTAFQFVFVFLQAAAFGGVFTGFAIAADFESGFARRLMLAAPHRSGLLAGYALGALVRFVLTGTVVTVAALLAGMEVPGSAADLFGLLVLALALNVTATMWGAGVAFRTRTLQAAPAMQIPVFIVLFLAPVYVPLDLLDGWIHAVASWNPLTAVLEAGRSLLAGEPEQVAVALACAAGLLLALAAWGLTGLRRAEEHA